MPLLVALWSQNTEAKTAAGPKTTVMNTQLRGLFAALQKTQEKLSAVAAGPGFGVGRMKGIFLAPEYLFSRYTEDGVAYAQPDSISAAARDVVLNILLAESRTYPDLLIVPGTISYFRPRDAVVNGAAKLDKWKATLAERDAVRVNSATPRVSVFNPTGVDHPREATFTGLKGPLLEGETAAGTNRVIRNRAYLLFNGTKVASYAKMAEINEVVGPGGVYIPGRKTGLVTLEGMLFGCEICRDHACGLLKVMAGGRSRVDIHLMTSAAVDSNPAGMAMHDAGFFLHASSNDAYTGVWHREGGREKPVERKPGTELGGKPAVYLGSETVGGAPLHFYLIDSPLRAGAQARVVGAPKLPTLRPLTHGG